MAIYGKIATTLKKNKLPTEEDDEILETPKNVEEPTTQERYETTLQKRKNSYFPIKVSVFSSSKSTFL
jgi:hypothetical protein